MGLNFDDFVKSFNCKAHLPVSLNDEGCSATPQLESLRSRLFLQADE
jgi:hypothetical protein